MNDTDFIGRSLSHFRITERIGAGGMGVVYRARDEHLHRDVAIKVLPPGTIGDDTARKRFRREALALARLRHPNIATVFDFDRQDDTDFLVMEYIPGSTLSDRLAAGPLPEREVARLGVQLAEGLAAAHAQGIVHRDLKPCNLMTGTDGRLSILDFGLATLVNPVSSTAATETWAETRGVAGTLPYMAPEQLRGDAVDARTDIHAAGAVLYEMSSGKPAFHADTVPSLTDAILHDAPAKPRTANPLLSPELEGIILKCLNKEPERRYQSAEALGKALSDSLAVLSRADAGVPAVRHLAQRLRRPRVAIPIAVGAVLLALGSYWYAQRQSRIRWARDEALPEIERLIGTNDVWRNLTGAYAIAERAEQYIPGDSRLARLFSACSLRINIRTAPSGAKVYVREYRPGSGEWKLLGVTPIEKLRQPIGIFQWKLEKDGFETVAAAAATWDIDISKRDVLLAGDLMRTLDKQGTVPPGMVRVSGADTDIGRLSDFFIDKYEVTNRQFKSFMDAGGYRRRQYWTERFAEGGTELRWEQAMKAFVDQSGLPGPAAWQAGDYPEGQADYPVSGISWYEAAAYAEYAGKRLPTGRHWGMAMGQYTPLIQYSQLGGFAVFAPFSNFRGKGPVQVGSLGGITSYGAADMAGNVREWCWNETRNGRVVRGGAWDDNTYMFGNLSQAPAMDRSSRTGVRCASYPDAGKIPPEAFQLTSVGVPADFQRASAVAGPVFEAYKERMSYDPIELKASTESREVRPGEWTHETVSFQAAYGGERVLAHLFLPAQGRPPYQAVVYFPGTASQFQTSSKDIERYYEFPMFLSFIVKNGRAVLYPVYKGTFERGNETMAGLLNGDQGSHQFAELIVQEVKDFRRSLDYLQSRPDIDKEKLAFYGMSWGGQLGTLIPAVEPRLRASVLIAGSLSGLGPPDVNDVNYVPRVTVPTLMLNGVFDTLSPVDTSIRPTFALLGTPPRDKRLILYQTDHIPPMNELIKESLAWFDRYLGPVAR